MPTSLGEPWQSNAAEPARSQALVPPQQGLTMRNANAPFPDFDELDEDLIRIFSNYNRHMTQTQSVPAARSMTEAFPPAISVAPVSLQPVLQSFQGLASSDRRTGSGGLWANPGVLNDRSYYPSPLVQTPLGTDLFSQTAASNVQAQSTAFAESPQPSAEIDVDEIMAYSPYAANPKPVHETKHPAAPDSDRVYVFRRGELALDNPVDPVSQQSFASQASQRALTSADLMEEQGELSASMGGRACQTLRAESSAQGYEKEDTDDDYSKKKKDAVTIRGRKAHRLQLNEKHYSEDAHESGHMRSKHHKPWTTEETVALVWAVEKVGGGKWAEIKKMKYRESDPLERRSAVDLKDKWRNLQNAIDRPASEKKKELSPELADRIRRMRSACNTKARGDSRKHPASKRSYTPSSLSPPTRTPEAQPIEDLQNPTSSPISGLPLTRSNFTPPASEPDDES